MFLNADQINPLPPYLPIAQAERPRPPVRCSRQLGGLWWRGVQREGKKETITVTHSLLHLAAVMAAAAAGSAAAIGDVIRLFNDHSGVPALWTPGGGCPLSACPCVGLGWAGAVGVASLSPSIERAPPPRPAPARPCCIHPCESVWTQDVGRTVHANPTRDNARRALRACVHPSDHPMLDSRV